MQISQVEFYGCNGTENVGAAAVQAPEFGSADIHFEFPVVIFPVAVIDFAQYPAGIAEGDDVGGNVPGHDAARTDHAVVADAHARQDHRARTDPDVVADMNRDVELGGLAAKLRINRMAGGGHRHIRPEHHAVADVNVRVVHQRQVEVGVHVAAEMGVFPPIGVKRRLDVTVFPHFRENAFQEFLTFLHFGGAGLVEVVQPIQALQLLAGDFRVGAEIKFAVFHSFSDIHRRILRLDVEFIAWPKQ